MKKTVSIIIVLILFVSLSLQSCDYFSFSGKNRNIPTSYIGGYEGIHNGMGLEFYWVETYDEMLEAVDLLKSYGSTFKKSMLFNYEGDLFDIKYCFTMNSKNSDSIYWGENPFARRSLDVRVHSVAFFEDYTVDYVTERLVSQLDAYELNMNYTLEEIDNTDYTELPREWSVDIHASENAGLNVYKKVCSISVDDNKTIRLEGNVSTNPDTMSDECLDALLGSITYFGFE